MKESVTLDDIRTTFGEEAVSLAEVFVPIDHYLYYRAFGELYLWSLVKQDRQKSAKEFCAKFNKDVKARFEQQLELVIQMSAYTPGYVLAFPGLANLEIRHPYGVFKDDKSQLTREELLEDALFNLISMIRDDQDPQPFNVAWCCRQFTPRKDVSDARVDICAKVVDKSTFSLVIELKRSTAKWNDVFQVVRYASLMQHNRDNIVPVLIANDFTKEAIELCEQTGVEPYRYVSWPSNNLYLIHIDRATDKNDGIFDQAFDAWTGGERLAWSQIPNVPETWKKCVSQVFQRVRDGFDVLGQMYQNYISQLESR